jgi:hypothetical protein
MVSGHLPVFFTVEFIVDGSVVSNGRLLLGSVVINGGLVVVVFAESKKTIFKDMLDLDTSFQHLVK